MQQNTKSWAVLFAIVLGLSGCDDGSSGDDAVKDREGMGESGDTDSLDSGEGGWGDADSCGSMTPGETEGWADSGEAGDETAVTGCEGTTGGGGGASDTGGGGGASDTGGGEGGGGASDTGGGGGGGGASDTGYPGDPETDAD